MCGKDRRPAARHTRRGGSPPRVREGPAVPIIFETFSGITPACAGRTETSRLNRRTARDHPRVCGKDFEQLQGEWGVEGSPPRVREGLRQSEIKLNTLGITPACAGRTAVDHRFGNRVRDHPRVCGKDYEAVSDEKMKQGSPPRVREGLILAVRIP